MTGEFSAQHVTLEVLEHLERRRGAIVDDEAHVLSEVKTALEPIAKEYAELELPPSYFAALQKELEETIPGKWLPTARAYTALEKNGFRAWRGGDVIARVTYVFAGLALGGLVVEAPFIPIWEKWFPFALAAAAWWLPDAQVRWHKRRYSKRLGEIASEMAEAQHALDRHVTLGELMPAAEEEAEAEALRRRLAAGAAGQGQAGQAGGPTGPTKERK